MALKVGKLYAGKTPSVVAAYIYEAKRLAIRRWPVYPPNKLMGDDVFVVLDHTVAKRCNKYGLLIQINIYKILVGDCIGWVHLPNDSAWILKEKHAPATATT